jgi:hypothetical protein
MLYLFKLGVGLGILLHIDFLSFVLAQIMHAFSVAPFDQNLSIDGKILSDDCATLGTLGVIPESVILLKVSSSCLAEDL